MRRLVLGTAGHIDHGKTALVRALTGQDPDRLPEEKRRGITIDLGFAHLRLPGCEYAVVDVPGHESLVRNMLAGATGIDLVLLVIAADEGVMPQTREHLAIMELLAVRQAIVAITKTDLVAPDWLELVLEEVREQLAGSPYADCPVLPVSATTGAGLDRLRAELEAAAGRCPGRATDDLFRLPVDRVFTIRGTGTVVTGTVWSGQVRSDSVLRALPDDSQVRLRGLQRHGAAAEAAGAGERVALAVALPRDAVQRGSTLVDHPGWQSATTLTVRLHLLADAPPLKHRQRVHLHLGTSEVLGRCVGFGEPLAPGRTAWGQLLLEAPVVARAGDRFVVRSYSPVHTIAGGIVAEPAAPRRRRIDPETVTQLERVLHGPDRIGAVVALNPGGLPLAALPLLTGLAPPQLEVAGSDDVFAAGDRLFPRSAASQVREQVLTALQRAHDVAPIEPGLTREELRRAAPQAPAPLLDQVVASLGAEGKVIASGTAFALPEFRPTPNAEQRGLALNLLGVLREAGIAAPRLAELPPDIREHPQLAAVVRYLVREQLAVALAHDHLAHPEAIAAAHSALAAAFREQAVQGASRLKEVLGVTRKHLIPLLEYFDRVGVTRRDGDERRAGPGLRTSSGEGA